MTLSLTHVAALPSPSAVGSAATEFVIPIDAALGTFGNSISTSFCPFSPSVLLFALVAASPIPSAVGSATIARGARLSNGVYLSGALWSNGSALGAR